MVDGEEWIRKPQKNTKFKCDVCLTHFVSEYRLKTHRKETGHKARRGRPVKK